MPATYEEFDLEAKRRRPAGSYKAAKNMNLRQKCCPSKWWESWTFFASSSCDGICGILLLFCCCGSLAVLGSIYSSREQPSVARRVSIDSSCSLWNSHFKLTITWRGRIFHLRPDSSYIYGVFVYRIQSIWQQHLLMCWINFSKFQFCKNILGNRSHF